MERTRRRRPANNSTGGHSFSTTVCRAANQLQRFYGSTRHQGDVTVPYPLGFSLFSSNLKKEATAGAKQKIYKCTGHYNTLDEKRDGVCIYRSAIIYCYDKTPRCYISTAEPIAGAVGRVYPYLRWSIAAALGRTPAGLREWSICDFFISSLQILLDCKASKRGI